MKRWLRQSIIVLVSILTFGAVTPSHALWSEEQGLSRSQHRGQAPDESSRSLPVVTESKVDVRLKKDQILALMTDKAEQQAMMKFGPKISNVIENEFREVILPNIEAAIHMTAAQFQEEAIENLAMTETPGGGISEKIFHIYHAETKKDVIRFHVRRDKPPLEGYIFNFHYHTYHDEFQTHYSIGTIYWDKNTPPNWQTV